MAEDTALATGFADPVRQSQEVFRDLLDAFAHPTRVKRLRPDLFPPVPLSEAQAAALLTLADRETPVWLSESLREPAVMNFLRFHCGAALVENPEAAVFAVVGERDLPHWRGEARREPSVSLASFATGDERYPDRSCTVLIEVAALTGGPAYGAKGPGIPAGIQRESQLAPLGLDAAFWTEWASNCGLFPLGVDAILTASDSLLALPRTTLVYASPGSEKWAPKQRALIGEHKGRSER